MARPLRIIFKGAWYHVMNRGANRQKISFSEKHSGFFLSILGEITKTYGIEIHAYCLMSNHYHLIIHTPRGNLSNAMRHLNSKYTQLINLDLKRDGALFRGRYKSILISAEDYLIRLSRYIHLNPLVAKMTSDLKKYKWSSYPHFIFPNNKPTWLFVNEILNRYQKMYKNMPYKDYVENTDDSELQKLLDQPVTPPILGSENFCQIIFNQIKSKSLSPEIVGMNRIIAPPSFSVILKSVATYFQVQIVDIQFCSKRTLNLPRRSAIFLSREIGGYQLKQIAQIMGDVSYKTISNSISATKKNPVLMKHIMAIQAQLTKNSEC